MNHMIIKNARSIVTCDKQDTVYHDSDILIQDGVIKQIGKDLNHPQATLLDAQGKIVYPGMINTHHHFFQTFVRNLISVDYPNMTVPQWLDAIYRIFQLVDDEVIYYSTLTAFADLIKHGCTTAFDHQYCFTNLTGNRPIDRQFEAAKQLGIRYHAGRGTNTLPREKGSTIPQNMLETTDQFLSDCERIITSYHDPSPYSMSRIVVAPCQPINSYQDTFVQAIDLARKHQVRLHTHLGEGENDIMLEKYGKRTLQWCEDIGFIGPDVWYAHCWELGLDEFARMGEAGTGVSHCPAPAILGGHPILPIKELKNLNVRLSLGVDGSATNDGSSMLDTLRLAFMMQAYNSKRHNGSCSAYDLLKIATQGGADILGCPELGSLEAGKGADLFMIQGDSLQLVGTSHDPKNLLGRVGVTDQVALTMIAGKIVFQDGELTGIDEAALAKAGEATCNRALRSKCDAFY